MKKVFIKSCVSIIIALSFICAVMLGMFLAPTRTAYADTISIQVSETNIHVEAPSSSSDLTLNQLHQLSETETLISCYLEDYYQKTKEDLAVQNAIEKAKKDKKDNLEKAAKSLKAVNENLPNLVKSAKEGDADKAVESALKMISGIASAFGPYGQLAGACIDTVVMVTKLIMGGEDASSEIAMLSDSITQQFNEVKDELAKSNDNYRKISNEISEQTSTILSSIKEQSNLDFAKRTLVSFLSNTEGNFSYTQYKNYVWGADSTENVFRSTAYYDKIDSYRVKANNEIEKSYYDALYSALVTQINMFYDYLQGVDGGKSIIKCYYDVLSNDSSLLKPGETPASQTIIFASDLVDTQMRVIEALMSCNQYQYEYVLSNDLVQYKYDSSSGDFVSKDELKDAEIVDQALAQLDDILCFIARDMAYVLGLSDFYVVEENASSANSYFYQIHNNDNAFANVIKDQTIYLFTVPDSICETLGLNETGYYYSISSDPTNTTGVFQIDNSNIGTIYSNLYYTGYDSPIASIEFHVIQEGASQFCGGNGTEYDPYRIAFASQFNMIKNGMDKHYELIRDIDFNGATIAPIGHRLIDGSTTFTDDCFSGTLDGKGHIVRNLTVSSNSTYAGLFARIDWDGVIRDTVFSDINVVSTIKGVECNKTYYGGTITGQNLGSIIKCEVTSTSGYDYQDDSELSSLLNYTFDIINWENKYKGYYNKIKGIQTPKKGVSVRVDNENKNRNIIVYVGGFAGENNNFIDGCEVNNIHIYGTSVHSYGGDSAASNKNNVYSGGICASNDATISNCGVDSSVKIRTIAKSIFNKGTLFSEVRPRITALSGGISAICGSNASFKKVYSEADIILSKTAMKNKANCWVLGTKYLEEDAGTYMPKKSTDYINSMKAGASYNTTHSYRTVSAIFDIKLDYTRTAYQAGEHFDYNDISLSVNDISLPYYLSGSNLTNGYYTVYLYGFNTQNMSFANSGTMNISMLFVVYLQNGSSFCFKQDYCGITVGKNYLIEPTDSSQDKRKVSNIMPEYSHGSVGSVIGSFNPLDLDLQCYYAVGGKQLFHIYSLDSIEKITYLENDIEKIWNSSSVLPLGKNELTLYYIDTRLGYDSPVIPFTFDVNVVCAHQKNPVKDVEGNWLRLIQNDETTFSLYQWNPNSNMYDVFVTDAKLKQVSNETYLYIWDGNAYGEEISLWNDGYMPQQVSCSQIGKETYVCACCNAIKQYAVNKLPHELIKRNDAMAPTCYAKGWTASIGCTNCDYTLVQREEIGQIKHNYVSYQTWVESTDIDKIQTWSMEKEPAYYHQCLYCGEYETHQYNVTESVEYIKKDGAAIPVLTYTFTCYECGFSYKKHDTNTITAEELLMPYVVISDEYAVHGNDLVTIYVQIANNPGIYGANFGIRYDERLELTYWEYGDILTSVKNNGTELGIRLDNEVPHGINFAWGQVTIKQGDTDKAVDGNLLKLVFKVPADADTAIESNIGESFKISIVYGLDASSPLDYTYVDGIVNADELFIQEENGGFVFKDKGQQVKRRLLTRDGFIRIVSHLPGDVNNDDVVDILDAMEIGRKLVLDQENAIDVLGTAQYANVDLEKGIDINDMLYVMRSIVGLYDADFTGLLYPTFNVNLNYGCDTFNDEPSSVVLTQGESYNKVNQDLERIGYKFLGWHTTMYGSDASSNLIGDSVTYQKNQRQQTLYAWWELNEIVFDGNGNTNSASNMPNISALDAEYNTQNQYIKEYLLGLNNYHKGNDIKTYTLQYSLAEWTAYDTSNQVIGTYATIADATSLLEGAHLGKIRLQAIWNNPCIEGLNKEDWLTNGYYDIVWYTAVDNGTYDDDDILDLWDIQAYTGDFFEGKIGKISMFARYIPIEYTLQFLLHEANTPNATSWNKAFDPIKTQVSIDKPYTLDASPTYLQCELKKWAWSTSSTIDGITYTDGSIPTFGYLPGVNNGDTVFVHACWQSNLNVAYDDEKEGYEIIGLGDYDLSKGEGGASNFLVIPEYLYTTANGLGICKSIANNAFSNDSTVSTISEIISINVPDSITNISDASFYGCSNLVSLTIPYVDTLGALFGTNTYVNSVKTVQNNVSYYIPEGLKSVTITKGSIGAYAFSNCTMIESINITKCTSLQTGAFSNCSGLQQINIPEGITTIPENTFYNCFNISSIVIPNSVTTIATNAFHECSSLYELVIPDNVSTIEDYAFNKCEHLTNIYISGKLNVSQYAFSGCSNICYTVYDNAYYLGNESNPYVMLIKSKPNVMSCVLHSNTRGIARYAFYDNTELTSIELNPNVSINVGSFLGCTNITNDSIFKPSYREDTVFSAQNGFTLGVVPFVGDRNGIKTGINSRLITTYLYVKFSDDVDSSLIYSLSATCYNGRYSFSWNKNAKIYNAEGEPIRLYNIDYKEKEIWIELNNYSNFTGNGTWTIIIDGYSYTRSGELLIAGTSGTGPRYKQGLRLCNSTFSLSHFDVIAPTVQSVVLSANDGVFTQNGITWTKSGINITILASDSTGDNSNAFCAGLSLSHTYLYYIVNDTQYVLSLEGTETAIVNGNVRYTLTTKYPIMQDFNTMSDMYIKLVDMTGNESIIKIREHYTNKGVSQVNARLDTIAPDITNITANVGTYNYANKDIQLSISVKDYGFAEKGYYNGGRYNLYRYNNGSGIKGLYFYSDENCTIPFDVNYNGNETSYIDITSTYLITTQKTISVFITYDTMQSSFGGNLYLVAVDQVGNRSDGKEIPTSLPSESIGGFPGLSSNYTGNRTWIYPGVKSITNLKRDTYVPQVIVMDSTNEVIANTAGVEGTGLNYSFPWTNSYTQNITLRAYYGCSGGILYVKNGATIIQQITVSAYTTGGNDITLTGQQNNGNYYDSKSATGSSSYSSYEEMSVTTTLIVPGEQTYTIYFVSKSGVQSSIISITTRLDPIAPTVQLLGFSENDNAIFSTSGLSNLIPESQFLNSNNWIYPLSDDGYYAIFKVSDSQSGFRTSSNYGVNGTSNSQNQSHTNKCYQKINGATFYSSALYMFEFYYDDNNGNVYSYSITGDPIYKNGDYYVQVKMFARNTMGSLLSNGAYLYSGGRWNVSQGTYLRYKLGVSDFAGNVGYAVETTATKPMQNRINETEWNNTVLRYYVDPFPISNMTCNFYELNRDDWDDSLIENPNSIVSRGHPYNMTPQLSTGWTNKYVVAVITVSNGLSGYSVDYRYQDMNNNYDYQGSAQNLKVYHDLQSDESNELGTTILCNGSITWIVFDNTQSRNIQVAFGVYNDSFLGMTNEHNCSTISAAVSVNGPEYYIIKQDISAPRIQEMFFSVNSSYNDAINNSFLRYQTEPNDSGEYVFVRESSAGNGLTIEELIEEGIDTCYIYFKPSDVIDGQIGCGVYSVSFDSCSLPRKEIDVWCGEISLLNLIEGGVAHQIKLSDGLNNSIIMVFTYS